MTRPKPTQFTVVVLTLLIIALAVASGVPTVLETATANSASVTADETKTDNQNTGELYDNDTAGESGGQMAATTDTESKALQVEELFIVSTNSPVTEGETLRVTASVSAGDGSVDDVFELRIDGRTVDQRSVFVDQGATKQVTFEWNTQTGDAGQYGVTVVGGDRIADASVTVQAGGPEFVVDLASTNSPVIEGETLVVETIVENIGGSGSDQLDLRIGERAVSGGSPYLDAGESRSVFFEWPTTIGDAGQYEGTVTGGQEPVSTDVIVQPQQQDDDGGNFQVSLQSTPENTDVGDALEFWVLVENTAESSGTRDIELRIDGSLVASETVSLDGGQTRTLNLVWRTGPDDAGQHTATIDSGDNAVTTEVTVGSPATYIATIEETSSPVSAGETLEVSGTVENTGDLTGNNQIQLVVDGRLVATESLRVGGGRQADFNLRWNTEEEDAGEYTAVVQTAAYSDSTEVTVEGPNEFDLEVEDTNSPRSEGEKLNVTANVENRGTETTNETISLDIDGETRGAKNVTLDGNESTTVTLSWPTGAGDAGEYSAELKSENDNATADVTVVDDARPFMVGIQSTNKPLTEGETLEVVVEVTNPGALQRQEQITLSSRDTIQDSQVLEIPSNESQSATLTWNTTTGDAGEYDVLIESADGLAAAAVVTVDEAEQESNNTFVVTIENVSTPTDGASEIRVNATVENTGETADMQTVTLRSGGETRGSRNISLAGGEAKSVTFSWEQDGEQELDIEVASETDEDRASAVIAEGSGEEDGGETVSTEQIAGSIVLLVILGAAYYYVRRRKQDTSDASVGNDSTPEGAQEQSDQQSPQPDQNQRTPVDSQNQQSQPNNQGPPNQQGQNSQQDQTTGDHDTQPSDQ